MRCQTLLTFSAAERHHPLAGTKLYCLVTEGVSNLPSCCLTEDWPRVKLMTICSRSHHPEILSQQATLTICNCVTERNSLSIPAAAGLLGSVSETSESVASAAVSPAHLDQAAGSTQHIIHTAQLTTNAQHSWCQYKLHDRSSTVRKHNGIIYEARVF